MNEVTINKQTKLSEHFTLGELTKTSYDMLDKNIPLRCGRKIIAGRSFSTAGK